MTTCDVEGCNDPATHAIWDAPPRMHVSCLTHLNAPAGTCYVFEVDDVGWLTRGAFWQDGKPRGQGGTP